MRLPTICQNLFGSQTFLELGRILTVWSRGVQMDLQSAIPNLKSILKYSFGGVDHFDLEKVMKVPQVLHIKRYRKMQLDTADFI